MLRPIHKVAASAISSYTADLSSGIERVNKYFKLESIFTDDFRMITSKASIVDFIL